MSLQQYCWKNWIFILEETNLHSYFTSDTKIKQTDNTKLLVRMWSSSSLQLFCRRQNFTTTLKYVTAVSNKTKHRPAFDLRIPLLDIFSREMKTCLCKNYYMEKLSNFIHNSQTLKTT